MHLCSEEKGRPPFSGPPFFFAIVMLSGFGCNIAEPVFVVDRSHVGINFHFLDRDKGLVLTGGPRMDTIIRNDGSEW